jgi:TusA-related sulfurtransferase
MLLKWSYTEKVTCLFTVPVDLFQGARKMGDTVYSNRAHQVLDCIGLYCPAPVMKTREEINKLTIGDILEVLADDPAAEPDIKAWAKHAGQKILKVEKTSEGLRFLIQKIK